MNDELKESIERIEKLLNIENTSDCVMINNFNKLKNDLYNILHFIKEEEQRE